MCQSSDAPRHGKYPLDAAMRLVGETRYPLEITQHFQCVAEKGAHETIFPIYPGGRTFDRAHHQSDDRRIADARMGRRRL